MRLKGRAECRALYFDLINIACDQSPVGTIPNDMEVLAKLLMISESEFKTLCQLEYGPLHKWRPCRCGDEVRLMHPVVLDMLIEAVAAGTRQTLPAERAREFIDAVELRR